MYSNIISKVNYILYFQLFNNFLYYVSLRFYNLFFFIIKTKLFLVSSLLKYNSLLQFTCLIDGTVIDFLEKKKGFL